MPPPVDSTTQALAAITAIAVTVGFALQIILQVLMKRASVKARKETNKKLDVLVETGEKTHGLVNSSMREQIVINLMLAKRVHQESDNHKDLEMAEALQKKLDLHDEQQAKVDRETREKNLADSKRPIVQE